MAYSKYIKPQHLQASNQKVAHIIIGFNDRKATNRAIEHSLFIEGKQTTVHKLLSKPKRCLKCLEEFDTKLKALNNAIRDAIGKTIKLTKPSPYTKR